MPYYAPPLTSVTNILSNFPLDFPLVPSGCIPLPYGKTLHRPHCHCHHLTQRDTMTRTPTIISLRVPPRITLPPITHEDISIPSSLDPTLQHPLSVVMSSGSALPFMTIVTSFQ